MKVCLRSILAPFLFTVGVIGIVADQFASSLIAWAIPGLLVKAIICIAASIVFLFIGNQTKKGKSYKTYGKA